ncbi:MAG: hypothetical protein AAF914_04355 [Pseudomonadota bacterium]
MTARRLVARIGTLLESQADCLRIGNLEGAIALGPKIERLVDRLDTQTPSQADRPPLQALVAQAEATGALIEAAQRGVADARAMLMQPDNTGFQTYDAHGRRTAIGSVASPPPGMRTGR